MTFQLTNVKISLIVLTVCLSLYLFYLSVLQVLGYYLRVKKDPTSFINEIKSIASDPDEKYFFNVTDEAALNDIVDALGERIFSLEGKRQNIHNC